MFSPDDSPEHLCYLLYLLQATKHLPARPRNKLQTLHRKDETFKTAVYYREKWERSKAKKGANSS